MPLHLEPVDVQSELDDCRSALIISCPVCPPVSVAMQRGSPWIEVFRHGVKTGAFEAYIDDLRRALQRRGMRTGVFRMYVPSPMMCVWTSGQRRRLARHAAGYDAVVVLGCESARVSVERALAATDTKVVLAMELTGLTNALATFEPPMNVTLSENALVHDDGSVDEIAA